MEIDSSEIEIENHVVLTFDPLVRALIEYDTICYLVGVLTLSMLKDVQFAEAIKHSRVVAG